MDKVWISNNTKDKINKIKSDGLNNLHIIADFDKTLTKTKLDSGDEFKSIMGVIRHEGFLGEEYDNVAFGLFDKYHPYEIDPDLSIPEKCVKMEEWWQTNLNMQIKNGMNQDVVNKIINGKFIPMRDNINIFFDLIDKYHIPLLVFSAGLGDIIEGLLNKYNINDENVNVISNFYDFDSTGKIKGYKGKIIHTFNKGEVAIKNDLHFNYIKDKKNVILLGDSLGDLDMAKGVDHNVVLKIGFFNKGDDRLLEKYKEYYDVLILNDGPMDYINNLLKEMIK